MIGAYEKRRRALFTHQIVLPGLEALSLRHLCIALPTVSPDICGNLAGPLRYSMEVGILIPKALRMRKSTRGVPRRYETKKTITSGSARPGLNNLMSTESKAMATTRKSLTFGDVVRNVLNSSVETCHFFDSSSVSSKSKLGEYFKRRESVTSDNTKKRSPQPLNVFKHKKTQDTAANFKAKSVQLKFNRANLLSFVFTRIISSFTKSIPQITRNTLYFRSLMPKKEI